MSPSIDALAHDGVLFENHVSAAPWTTPAHMSILTSLYPSAHGVTDSSGALMDGLRERRPYSILAEAHITLAETLARDGYTTAAFTGGRTMDPSIGFDQGFEKYDTSMFKLDDSNMAKLYAWIDQHKQEPFFLFWHTFEVHMPFTQTLFLSDILPLRASNKIGRDLASILPDLRTGKLRRRDVVRFLRDRDIFTREVCEALYVGGIRTMDAWLGQFLEELRRLGLYDSSLIILTSDHGEEFGDHSSNKIYDAHGHSLYEELLHVPLIIRLPGTQTVGTRIVPVSHAVDIMPTILELVGVTETPESMQGVSLRPLWGGGAANAAWAPKRPVLSESLGGRREKKSLRVDHYKYIFSFGQDAVAEHGRAHLPDEPGNRELFDLRADPGEHVNLLESPDSDEAIALAIELEHQLREFIVAMAKPVERAELGGTTIEGLEGLGYVK